MTPEEVAAKAAADAAATKAAADAGAGTKDAAYWEKVAKEAIEGREKAKEKLKSLEPLASEGQKALDARKTAEERAVELARERDTYKTQAEEATAAMTSRLALEIQAIPEAMRGLVPATLTPAKQLEWIGQAQAAGLFAPTRTASPGAQLPGNVGGATVTQAQVAAMSTTARNKIYADVAAGKISIVAA